VTVIWHDLECGGYAEDLPLWRELAARHGGPVLDVGAGTGRTALALARSGYSVIALDLDAELLAALRERAAGVDLETVQADACDFVLDQRFPLCIVPMQTIQLLDGAAGRTRCLRRLREHLCEGGVVGIAIADELEAFEVPDGAPSPMPDVCEFDGVVYSSRPTAIRADGPGFVLERRREIVSADGSLSGEDNLIRLDRLDAATLEREASTAGLRPAGRWLVAPTEEYVGSVVVMLSA